MKIQFCKKLHILAFLLFLIMNSCGQANEKGNNKPINNVMEKNKISNTKKNMKKLDQKILEKYKKNNQLTFTENDSIFKLDDQFKTYRETKSKKGEHLKTVSFYDKNKRHLLAEGNYLFDFPIGIHTSYDLEGSIIKEQNFDKDFPFSFQELKQKLLHDFNINTENINLDLRIDRGLDTSDMKFKYTIFLYSNDRLTYRFIVIDGTTGDTIKDLNVKSLD
ncbi:hypothetical protein [Flavobacterium sp. LHD-85]|uniref:hypothetical protein n=1 Tax=Flavobacterium sp. LHD-85 TaxID=3071410 RepID=UPI0027E1D112|nr:hypothetical protein [Flavobacterium sp. LHD-85]MDQ6531273.1 hypothetical protein [Flavobacterium sp. LHD-85]